jgi:hypothetical protein
MNAPAATARPPLGAATPGTMPGEMARLRALLAQAGERVRVQAAEDPLGAHRGAVISDAAFARLLLEEERAAPGAEAVPPPEPRWPPLAGLAQRLGLDAFATDLVLLLLAAETEPALAAAMGYVQDDPQRRWPTLALAMAVFGADPAAARAALLPDAPLLRLRVVAVDEPGPLPLPLRALRLEPAGLGWLLQRFQPDPAVAPACAELPPPLLDAPLEAVAARLMARLADPHTAPRLMLTGPARSGRRAVAAEVARRLGLRLVALDPAALLASGEAEAALLATLGRDAALLDLAFLVDAAALSPAAERATPAAGFVQRLARGLEAVLVTLDVAGAPLPAETVGAELSEPGLERRFGLWRAALPEGHAVSPEGLAELAGEIELGPAEIVPIVAAAAAEAAGRRPVTAGDLRRAAKAQAAARVGGVVERVASSVTWDDLALPEEVTGALREIAAAARGRVRVMGAWGMARGGNGRGRGLAALFSGPSGTGKTTAAEALARELDLDLWRIDLAGTVSKWIGETEKALRQIFEAADAGGAILFFDEADALFGKRSEVKDARDRYANIEVDDLLQRIERHRGIAILATNRKGDLDPAFLRRIRHVVAFPFPDAATRRRIWAKVFPAQVPVEALDLDLLAGFELAGGSIRNVAVNAAYAAAAEGGAPVRMAHLRHAIRREYQKLEKLPVGLAAAPEPPR